MPSLALGDRARAGAGARSSRHHREGLQRRQPVRRAESSIRAKMWKNRVESAALQTCRRGPELSLSVERVNVGPGQLTEHDTPRRAGEICKLFRETPALP